MSQGPKTNPAFHTSAATADERRAHVRYPCEFDSSCSPISAARGSQWTGKVRDISQGGIGIILSRRFELGTLLSVEIQEPDGRSSGSLLARVVHVTPHSSGGWAVGCCFTSELSEEEVKNFVEN